MDVASPDTVPRVQPTCSSCRFYDDTNEMDSPESDYGNCRFSSPILSPDDNTAGVWPCIGEDDWCGQHLGFESWKELLDRQFGTVEKRVDLEALEELKDALSSCLIVSPPASRNAVYLEAAGEEEAIQLQTLLRRFQRRQDETPSDPKDEGG